jgi:5-deoxy-glucuronate isomerase
MNIHIKKQNTIFGFNQYFKYGKPGSFTPGLSILKLTNNPYTFESQKAEVFIMVLSGSLEITVEETQEVLLFQRNSVFDDLPCGLYLPPEKKVFIQAQTVPTEAAFCFSSELYLSKNETKQLSIKKITAADILRNEAGKNQYKRTVTTVCGAKNDTYSLIVGETLSEGGMWSSYPPHRHDKNDLPRENKLKEIYYYRINPPQGIAFQGLYSDVSGSESAYLVKDGDAIFISNGYHPVSAAPDYQLYYLWILCGQTPQLVWKFDEKHEWIDKT